MGEGGRAAAQLGKPAIPGGRHASIGLLDQPNARIANAANDLCSTVGRSVIDHDQRPVAMRLGLHRYDGIADPARRIVGRNHNTDVHAASMRGVVLTNA